MGEEAIALEYLETLNTVHNEFASKFFAPIADESRFHQIDVTCLTKEETADQVMSVIQTATEEWKNTSDIRNSVGNLQIKCELAEKDQNLSEPQLSFSFSFFAFSTSSSQEEKMASQQEVDATSASQEVEAAEMADDAQDAVVADPADGAHDAGAIRAVVGARHKTTIKGLLAKLKRLRQKRSLKFSQLKEQRRQKILVHDVRKGPTMVVCSQGKQPSAASEGVSETGTSQTADVHNTSFYLFDVEHSNTQTQPLSKTVPPSSSLFVPIQPVRNRRDPLALLDVMQLPPSQAKKAQKGPGGPLNVFADDTSSRPEWREGAPPLQNSSKAPSLTPLPPTVQTQHRNVQTIDDRGLPRVLQRLLAEKNPNLIDRHFAVSGNILQEAFNLGAQSATSTQGEALSILSGVTQLQQQYLNGRGGQGSWRRGRGYRGRQPYRRGRGRVGFGRGLETSQDNGHYYDQNGNPFVG